MPLPTRDHNADRMTQLRSDTRATRVVIKQISADHGCQAVGMGDDTENQQDYDFVQHYGFVSRPPADAEGIKLPADPIDVNIGELCDIPSGDLANIGTGETAIYDSSGNFVYMRGSGGAWMKTLAGPITIESKVKPVTIKVTGNPTVGAARLNDTVAVGVTPVNGMAIWMGLVQGAVAALGVVFPPGCPSDFGYISGCSSDVVIS
jgi:phage gp45-like